MIRVATWNINSVRLRIDLLRRLSAEHAPDVICLQEIKCADRDFPADAVAELGYPHVATAGQPGYHGVATLSRLPIEVVARENLDGSGEARHLAVGLKPAPRRKSLLLQNFYVPSGGDVADPAVNAKFAQKLRFLAALARWSTAFAPGKTQAMLVGDLNVAPLEHDVWSHRHMLDIVSHTPVEVEHLTAAMAAGGWQDVMRRAVPDDQKLYTWWSYRARDWRLADRGRRLDHVWATPQLATTVTRMQVAKDARDWPRPSDHVPVIVDLDL